MLRTDHLKVLCNIFEKLYNINTREKNTKKKKPSVHKAKSHAVGTAAPVYTH